MQFTLNWLEAIDSHSSKTAKQKTLAKLQLSSAKDQYLKTLRQTATKISKCGSYATSVDCSQLESNIYSSILGLKILSPTH